MLAVSSPNVPLSVGDLKVISCAFTNDCMPYGEWPDITNKQEISFEINTDSFWNQGTTDIV